MLGVGVPWVCQNCIISVYFSLWQEWERGKGAESVYKQHLCISFIHGVGEKEPWRVYIISNIFNFSVAVKRADCVKLCMHNVSLVATDGKSVENMTPQLYEEILFE